MITQLLDEVQVVQEKEHKLILVVGAPGSGKSKLLRQLKGREDVAQVNIYKELTRLLMALPRERWAQELTNILADIFQSYDEPILAVDNIEILFARELQADPLAIFAQFSKDRTLIVGWVGGFANNQLSWAVQGHPEFKTFPAEAFPGSIIVL